MLEKEFVRTQVRRLSGLRSFPADSEAIGEVITALRSSAPSEDDAARFVSEWARSNVEAPKPFDVYAHFAPRTIPEYAGPAPAACQQCGDTGWRSIDRDGYAFAVPCACRAKRSAPEQTESPTISGQPLRRVGEIVAELTEGKQP